MAVSGGSKPSSTGDRQAGKKTGKPTQFRKSSKNVRSSRLQDAKNRRGQKNDSSDGPKKPGARNKPAWGKHQGQSKKPVRHRQTDPRHQHRIEQPKRDFDRQTFEEIEEEKLKNLHPGQQRPDDEPEPPSEVDLTLLPRWLKAELRGLPKDLADKVGAHLFAAIQLQDDDPELANRHGQAAKRLAARLPAVREISAEAAYNAADYATALTEFRAVYRMSGNPDYLSVIADCERGIGKPDAALRTLKEAANKRVSPTQRIELTIVEAGARKDQGQLAEALRVLREAIKATSSPLLGKARLRYAYASFLEEAGQAAQARKWYVSASHFDVEKTLDISARIAKIDGIEYEDDNMDGFDFDYIEVADEEDAETSPTEEHSEQLGKA